MTSASAGVTRTPPTDNRAVQTRREHDLIGTFDVPVSAYYGVHTARAVENFPISGIRLSTYPVFIAALAAVKQAAAAANGALGLLSPEKTRAIIAACQEIRDGGLHEEFILDVIQGGAGTSTNMNANEVIANRALEHLGRSRGDYSHCGWPRVCRIADPLRLLSESEERDVTKA